MKYLFIFLSSIVLSSCENQRSESKNEKIELTKARCFLADSNKLRQWDSSLYRYLVELQNDYKIENHKEDTLSFFHIKQSLTLFQSRMNYRKHFYNQVFINKNYSDLFSSNYDSLFPNDKSYVLETYSSGSHVVEKYYIITHVYYHQLKCYVFTNTSKYGWILVNLYDVDWEKMDDFMVILKKQPPYFKNDCKSMSGFDEIIFSEFKTDSIYTHYYHSPRVCDELWNGLFDAFN